MTPRTADFIEETKSQKTEGVVRKPRKPVSAKSLANLRPYKPGAEWTGNPGGRPKVDVAAILARAVVEESFAEAKEGLKAQLRKGNAYAFKEMAERGYGKLKEIKEVTHLHEDVPTADIEQRLADLMRDLGLVRAVDEASGNQAVTSGASKTNGAAKDHDLLPG
jgi:hypothetical protein